MKTINIMTNMNYVYFFDTLYFVNLPYTVSFNTSGSSMLKLWKHFLLRGIICCQCITVYTVLLCTRQCTVHFERCVLELLFVYTLTWNGAGNVGRIGNRFGGLAQNGCWGKKMVRNDNTKWLLRGERCSGMTIKNGFWGGKMARDDNWKWLLRRKDGQEWQ